MVLHGRLCGRVDNRRLFFCHFARLLRWRRHSGGGNVRCSICSKFKANYGPEEFASRDTIVGDERWFSKRVQCAKDAALGLV